jgi:hypothetical protein
MLYGAGSKAVSIEELFGRYGDENFGNNENTSFECEDNGDNKRFIKAINALEFDLDFQKKRTMLTIILFLTMILSLSKTKAILLKPQLLLPKFLYKLLLYRWPAIAIMARSASFIRLACYFAIVASLTTLFAMPSAKLTLPANGHWLGSIIWPPAGLLTMLWPKKLFCFDRRFKGCLLTSKYNGLMAAVITSGLRFYRTCSPIQNGTLSNAYSVFSSASLSPLINYKVTHLLASVIPGALTIISQ